MIKQEFITHTVTRPALRPDGNSYYIRQLKGVVMHWTANEAKGADAMANRNYFNNGSIGPDYKPRQASAHYCVDDKSIIQCIPTNEVAFHCGDRPMGRYKKDGLNMIIGTKLTPNYFTIGIEMCVNAGSDWGKTRANSVWLAANEILTNKLTVKNNLFRHFDITGKLCPKMMLAQADWEAFKSDVQKEYDKQLAERLYIGRCNTDNTNVRNIASMEGKAIGVLYKGQLLTITATNGNWYEVWPGGWVHKSLVEKLFS